MNFHEIPFWDNKTVESDIGHFFAFLNTRLIVRKNSLQYIHNLGHIHTLFYVIFSGNVFAGMLAELPHTPTCFISCCWEGKVKEVWPEALRKA
jgi:hypothetical protein